VWAEVKVVSIVQVRTKRMLVLLDMLLNDGGSIFRQWFGLLYGMFLSFILSSYQHLWISAIMVYVYGEQEVVWYGMFRRSSTNNNSIQERWNDSTGKEEKGRSDRY